MSVTMDKYYFDKLYKNLNDDEYNNQTYDDKIYAKVIMQSKSDLKLLKPEIVRQLYINGYVVVSMGTKVCTEKLKNWLVSIFGTIMKDAGKKQVDVSIIAPEEGGEYFANSAFAQPMHTDEGHTFPYPRIAALYCETQASTGGVSVIVPFEKLYKTLLQNYSDDISLLFDKSAITVNNIYGIESKPLLIPLAEGRIGITYSGIIQGLKCSEPVHRIFDFITQYVHQPINQLRFRLNEGDILIVDNSRALHGRTRFNLNDKRTLYRIWFSKFPDVQPDCLVS